MNKLIIIFLGIISMNCLKFTDPSENIGQVSPKDRQKLTQFLSNNIQNQLQKTTPRYRNLDNTQQLNDQYKYQIIDQSKNGKQNGYYKSIQNRQKINEQLEEINKYKNEIKKIQNYLKNLRQINKQLNQQYQIQLQRQFEQKYKAHENQRKNKLLAISKNLKNQYFKFLDQRKQSLKKFKDMYNQQKNITLEAYQNQVKANQTRQNEIQTELAQKIQSLNRNISIQSNALKRQIRAFYIKKRQQQVQIQHSKNYELKKFVTKLNNKRQNILNEQK